MGSIPIIRDVAKLIQPETKMTEGEIVAFVFQDLQVFGDFSTMATVLSHVDFPYICSMRPEYAMNELTILQSAVLDDKITIHASRIIARHNIVLPADVTVYDAVSELFFVRGATMSELFHGGFAVSQRIEAIFDLANRGIDSETFHRVMTIVADLHVDATVAMALNGIMMV